MKKVEQDHKHKLLFFFLVPGVSISYKVVEIGNFECNSEKERVEKLSLGFPFVSNMDKF